MSPTLNGSTALQRFEHGNAVKVRNGIMFDFYLGLPHVGIYTNRRYGAHAYFLVSIVANIMV